MQMLIQLSVKPLSFIKNFLTFEFILKSTTENAIFLLKKQLRPEKVDYFNFKYEKEKNKHSAVINADKYIYYKNIYIFVNRLRNLITQYDEITIKKMIVSVLHDFALM